MGQPGVEVPCELPAETHCVWPGVPWPLSLSFHICLGVCRDQIGGCRYQEAKATWPEQGRWLLPRRSRHPVGECSPQTQMALMKNLI